MQSPARQTRSATHAARLSVCAPVMPPIVRTYGKHTRYRDRASQSGASSPDSTLDRGRSSLSGDSPSGSITNEGRSSPSVVSLPSAPSNPHLLIGISTDVKEVSGAASSSALATLNQSFHGSQTMNVSPSIF
jgi:hypothetical protein